MSPGTFYSSLGGRPPQSDLLTGRVVRRLAWGFLLLTLASLSINFDARADEKPQLTTAQAYELLRQKPVTREDISILKRADEILSSEAIWNRNDTRTCYRLADSWSLYCALREACIEVTGKFSNRRVAIEDVRFVVEDLTGWGDRKWPFHPLMEYNNLPTTKFEDIKKILKIAMEREAARLN